MLGFERYNVVTLNEDLDSGKTIGFWGGDGKKAEFWVYINLEP